MSQRPTTGILAPMTDVEREYLEANRGLIWNCVIAYLKKHPHTFLEKDDMFSAGVFGFVRAQRGYKPELGYQFSTYAVWWIRQAIQRADYEESPLIRLPNYLTERCIQLGALLKQQGETNGDLPSLPQLVALTGWTATQVLSTLQQMQLPYSLDFLLEDEEGEGNTLYEQLADEEAPEGETAALRREAWGDLTQAIDLLRTVVTDREFHALWRHVGEGATLDVVGKELQVTRERVRQLQLQAVEKITRRYPTAAALLSALNEKEQA